MANLVVRVSEERRWVPGAPEPPAPPKPPVWAGYLAMLLGSLGVLFGLIGAGTFVPYAELMGDAFRDLAVPMTAFSVAGLVVSAVGILAGRGLVRGEAWARTGVVAVAASLVVLVAAMATLYPVAGFLLVLVVPLWGLDVVLALRGSRRPHRIRPGASRRAA